MSVSVLVGLFVVTRLEPSSQGTGHPDLAGSAKPGLSSRPAWFTRNGV